jgi:hypothetical protein
MLFCRGKLIGSLFAVRLGERFPQYSLKRAFRRIPLYNEIGNGRVVFCALVVRSYVSLFQNLTGRKPPL